MKNCFRYALPGFAILVVVILTATCSLTTNDLTSESGISLVVGPGTTSRLLAVDEYNVTSVDIRIYQGSAEEFFLEWLPSMGTVRAFIPIMEPGTYVIDVVHHGEKNGETVSIIETDDVPLYPMIITTVKIVPGLVGKIDIDPGEIPSIEGCEELVDTWENITMTLPGPNGELISSLYGALSLEDGGEAVLRSYSSLEFLPDSSFKGTWSCKDGYIVGLWTHNWSDVEHYWVPIPGGDIPWTSYFDITVNDEPYYKTLILDLDFTGNEPPEPTINWYLTNVGESCYGPSYYGQWGAYVNYGTDSEPYIQYQYSIMYTDNTIYSGTYATEDTSEFPVEDAFMGIVTSCENGVMSGYHELAYTNGEWKPINYPFSVPIEVINSGHTMLMSVDLTGDMIPDQDWALDFLGL